MNMKENNTCFLNNSVISEIITESYSWNCPFRLGSWTPTVQLINPFTKFQNLSSWTLKHLLYNIILWILIIFIIQPIITQKQSLFDINHFGASWFKIYPLLDAGVAQNDLESIYNYAVTELYQGTLQRRIWGKPPPLPVWRSGSFQKIKTKAMA